MIWTVATPMGGVINTQERFWAAVVASLPLDPPISLKHTRYNWDALDDSLFGGLLGLGVPAVDILWPFANDVAMVFLVPAVKFFQKVAGSVRRDDIPDLDWGSWMPRSHPGWLAHHNDLGGRYLARARRENHASNPDRHAVANRNPRCSQRLELPDGVQSDRRRRPHTDEARPLSGVNHDGPASRSVPAHRLGHGPQHDADRLRRSWRRFRCRRASSQEPGQQSHQSPMPRPASGGTGAARDRPPAATGHGASLLAAGSAVACDHTTCQTPSRSS